MFRAKTLFVLGAGASFEADLPVGDALLEQIVELTGIKFDYRQQVAGDRLIVEALRQILDEGGAVARINSHLEAGRRLAQSAQQGLSIDNVIDALEDKEVELVGKLGIARAILKAEAASRPFAKPNEYQDGIDLRNFRNTWYSSLTKLLTENRRVSDFDDVFRNVEFIVFNYDRCLEQYLQFSLSSYFHVPIERAQAAINRLTVHRPYGVVGRLPWQDSDRPSVPFGGGGATDLAALVRQIRTFTEQVDDDESLRGIRNSVESADRIVFLGFGFHRQNVELIAAAIQEHTEVYGTAFNISKADQDVIETELEEAFEAAWRKVENPFRVTLAEVTCSAFFKEFWRTMTARPPYA